MDFVERGVVCGKGPRYCLKFGQREELGWWILGTEIWNLKSWIVDAGYCVKGGTRVGSILDGKDHQSLREEEEEELDTTRYPLAEISGSSDKSPIYPYYKFKTHFKNREKVEQ
jgi:hypothetical protein